MLHFILGLERKSWLAGGSIQDAFCDVFAQRRPMLESMPRPAANKPNIFGAGMPIDQKISARSIFVLANTSLNDRRVAQRGEPPRHVFSHLVCCGLADKARLRVWIDDRSVAI